jgi:hypothetical protein
VDISNSLLTTVTWTASYATTTADTFGTIGTPTKTQIATGTFTVTSTLTRYTANISVPAAATTGIEILFTVGAQISGTWQIGNVQFEAGSVATPFERLYYGTQLAQCQRYFFDTNPNSATTAISIGGYTAVASTYTFTSILFPVTMRSTPTISFRNQSYVNVTAIASGGASSTAFIPNVTSSAAGAVLVLYNYAAAAEIP